MAEINVDVVENKPTPINIAINRQCLTEKCYQEAFGIVEDVPKSTVASKLRDYVRKNCTPSVDCGKSFLLIHLPIIGMITTYDIRNYLLSDIISGLTVGVMQIAPTMGNSLMANLPPINGLYVAFFTVIVYAILGTSKHISLGTHGVISLMVGSTVSRYEGILYPSNSSANTSSEYLSSNPIEAKVIIATTLALMTGIIHIFLGLFKCGFIKKYLSDIVLDAFTVGSAFLIVISQIPFMLGFRIKHNPNIPIKLADEIYSIATNITKTNCAVLVISIVACVVLYVVKKINNHFKKILFIPIPIELLVIIITTYFSFQFSFYERWQVPITGSIPLGLPSIRIPPFKLFGTLIKDAIAISLVSFVFNISTAQYFCKKHNDVIDSNQELLAYGIGNILASLFGGFPGSAGLTRSLVVESTGARTQLFSIISSVLVLVVIFGLGFLFYTMPDCVLAAVIAVALIHKCLEVKVIFKLYKQNRMDAIIWLITLIGILIFYIDGGLYISICVSILHVILQTQLPQVSVLGNLPNTEMYEDINYCDKAKEIDGIKIIRYQAPLHYANSECFVQAVNRLASVDSVTIIAKEEVVKEEHEDHLKHFKLKHNKVNQTESNLEEIQQEKAHFELEIKEITDRIRTKHVILDLSCVSFVDSMGVDALILLHNAYKLCDVHVHLAHANRALLQTMNKYAHFQSCYHNESIYPSISDAVHCIQERKFSQTE